MEEKNKIQIRVSVSQETVNRMKNLSKKFHVKSNIAIEMAVYSLDSFGKSPPEIEQRLDRIEHALSKLISVLTSEEF